MDATSYLSQDLSIRQQHLMLDEECIERGGNSSIHRGVLAEYLRGNIYNKPADLCHACNNEKCSNPRHLYWGTRSENVKDSMKAGTWYNPYQKMVEEHGEEGAKNILSERAKLWHSERTVPQHTGTMYVNDGKISKRIQKSEGVPAGWKRGRLGFV